MQWVVVLLVGGGIGWRIYSYRQERNRATDTEALARAVVAENGRIGKGDSEPDRYTGLVDNRPAFATIEERSKAAEAEYRKAASSAKGGPSAALAELGLAGVLYDQGKFAEAKTAYEKVRDSDLAKLEPDAKGRAIEGAALSLEALGQTDQALTEYKRLENSDIPGFGPLGMYHQARLSFAKGEREKAKELLKKCIEKVTKSEDKSKTPSFAPPGYLEGAAKDLLQAIDPKAPELAAPAGGGSLDELMKSAGGPGGKLDAAKLQEMLKKLGGTPGLPKPAPAPRTGIGARARAGGQRTMSRLRLGLVGLGLSALCACTELRAGANPDVPMYRHRPSFALEPFVLAQGRVPARVAGALRARPTRDRRARQARVRRLERSRGLYALRADDGSHIWRFETLGFVQSQPLYDPVEAPCISARTTARCTG